ncbi:MAG: DDE-type integrase/transposase/recombinase [Planctomycetota bacterium]
MGIRATWPNEIWHVDVTVIKLLDGTRVYLHGIIDNFSRRVLAWKVAIRLEPASTVAVLVEAAQGLEARSERPKLLADGGGENFDGEVDELLADGLLQRLLAMTDVLSSNPMIESWWKTLKNQWLYLNSLDSLAGVEKLVRFYVEEYNGRIPHSAFKGQTPDEMYFGDGDRVPAELEAARVSAREIRLERNRATSCSACA